MLGLSNNELKGLWAVLWRVVVLVPFLWVLGALLMIGVLAAFILPPIYLICAFITGDWFFATAVIVGWLVLLRFGKRVLRWAFDGIEYSGI